LTEPSRHGGRLETAQPPDLSRPGDPDHRLDQKRPRWFSRTGCGRPKLLANSEFVSLVRVILVGMSNLLCNIVIAALAETPEISVAAIVGECDDINAEIRRARADAVILQSTEPGRAERFVTLLRRAPALRVVAIDGSANRCFVHQLRLCTTHVAELSAAALHSALRANAEPETDQWH